MKKLGFTLAEVLITLAIVGVIAALTIPGLTRNVAQKSIGPTLAKAVNNLNAVNKEALEVSGKTALHAIVSSDDEENADKDKYSAILEGYMGGTRSSLADEQKVGLPGAVSDATEQFLSNDGILYIVGALVTIWETEPVEDDTTTPDVDESADGVLKTFEGNYYGKYWPVLIDINGIGGKNNNALGYERFLVYVDSFGKVIPAGGEEAVLYGAETTVRAACTPEDVDERCIATVIKNAWEVTY